MVDSNLAERSQFPTGTTWLVGIIGKFAGVDADTGCFTSVFCAASPEMKKEHSGTYFQRLAEAGWQSGLAKDAQLAEKLQDWTQKEMRRGGWVQ